MLMRSMPEKKAFWKRFTEIGRYYFRKEDERRFCFILTLIMLALGILVKIGIWY